jgi:hypothetical protein
VDRTAAHRHSPIGLEPQPTGPWKYTKLYNFNESSGGGAPFYGLILDSHGDLYGVTSFFGKYGFGTAFEIIEATDPKMD